MWAKAKMIATKDLTKAQKGPFVYCLLDGTALEAVEHLTLDELSADNGDEAIWTARDARFPDKLQHDHMDHMAESFKEVFQLSAREGSLWLSGFESPRHLLSMQEEGFPRRPGDG